MRRKGVAIALVLAASAEACALVTDLGDLRSGADASFGDALPDVALPSSCGGAYECVTAAPTGWVGPFSLYDGNPNNAPSSCPTLAASSIVVGYVGVDAGAATCAACTSCAVSFTSTISVFASNCPTPPATCDAGFSDNTCVDLATVCATKGAFEISNPTFGCATTGPAPNIPSPTYDEKGVGCAAQQIEPIDCASGNVCIPTPAPPFNPSLCVGMSGDVTCPGAPYSVKHVFQTKIVDTRACSACGCTVQDAGSKWTSYASGTCGSFGIGLNPINNGCIFADNYAAFKGTATGSCTLTGPGSPIGSATATAPYTVCCQP